MKTLILMRHGKSSWEHPVSDLERPLLRRGLDDAAKVASFFAEQSYEIDAILSSPAERASMTCSVFTSVLNFPINKVVYKDGLYDFSGNSLAEVVYGLDDSLNTVMLFGHNFALTNLANSWGDKSIENVPTAGLVVLSFSSDSWRDVSRGGQTELFVKPIQITI